MKRSLFAGIALVAVYLVLPIRAPADLTSANSRKAALDFTLTDSKGTTVKLSDYKGRVVLLDFWGTFCGVCKTEIPWFMEFENKYKQRGFSVIGVSLDKDWKAVNPYVQAKKINYTVVIGNWDLANRFGIVNALPGTLLIDRDGKVADLHIGMVNKEAFESEIRVLLKDGTKNTVNLTDCFRPTFPYDTRFRRQTKNSRRSPFLTVLVPWAMPEHRIPDGREIRADDCKFKRCKANWEEFRLVQGRRHCSVS
jgi:peroxiredoxin